MDEADPPQRVTFPPIASSSTLTIWLVLSSTGLGGSRVANRYRVSVGRIDCISSKTS